MNSSLLDFDDNRDSHREVSIVTDELPHYWLTGPQLRLILAESNLALANIVLDTTKFH